LTSDNVVEALEAGNVISSRWERSRRMKGTGERPYLKYDGTTFQSDFRVPAECREEFQSLARELVDWRLGQYQDRGDIDTPDRFVCKVIHANGRPIRKLPDRKLPDRKLPDRKLPDRKRTPDVPEGWVDILVNERPHVANFVKQYVNVVRTDRESEKNVLAQIIRDWFGADAGRPGTGFQVSFERTGDQWRMMPIGVNKSS
jgi:hypothetical protein